MDMRLFSIWLKYVQLTVPKQAFSSLFNQNRSGADNHSPVDRSHSSVNDKVLYELFRLLQAHVSEALNFFLVFLSLCHSALCLPLMTVEVLELGVIVKVSCRAPYQRNSAHATLRKEYIITNLFTIKP